MLACLSVGAWFGGGYPILGEGEIQGSLKVISDTDLEVYVISVSDFLNYAGGEIVRYVI